MIDLTPIFQALIALAAALITAFLIPYIKTKMTTEQQENLVQWVEFAVLAAEQIYGSGMGQEKKAYVLEFLRQQGYIVDATQLEVLIEGAVKELLNSEDVNRDE